MIEKKKFDRLEEALPLIVKTKCPEKYLLIDRETGQVFVGSTMGHWDRLDPIVRD